MLRTLTRSMLLRLVITLVVMALFALPAAAQTSDEALLRFVHVVPGAAGIDIYTDGELTVSGLTFGSATDYIRLAAGQHQITVTQTGVTTPLWTQSITASAGTATTLVASSTNPLGFQSFPDDLNPLDVGEARLTAIHAIANAPAVDILLADGRPVIPNLEYNIPYGTLDVPSLAYEIIVVPAGQPLDSALIPDTTLILNSGSSYMIVAYGTPASPAVLVLSAPVRGAEGSGYARFVHGVFGEPAVNVYVNDQIVAPSLSFTDAGTDFIALPAGDHSLSVRTADTDDVIVSTDLSVTAGQYVTVVALAGKDGITVETFADDLAALTENEAIVGVINGMAEGTVSLSLAGEAPFLSDVEAGAASAAALTPSINPVVVTVQATGGTTSVSLDLPAGIYGGVYYTALVVDSGSGAQVVQLPPASIAQGEASAPGDTTISLTTTEVVEPIPVDTPAPTTEPAVEPTSAEVVVQPTEAPVVTEVTAAPTRAPGPTARVNLDPGANLHLRQYPSSSAFSLGLVPSGTVLDVIGRQGAPALGPLETPPPDATPYVDPASLLEPDQDLPPQETWLFVTYYTPDGGMVNAWVNALYLAVANAAGRPQRLADLPTVPANRAGEAVNTAISAPTLAPTVATVTIIGLDPGVNLNIRRTQGTDGESLALVPAGTTMTLEGVSEDRAWVFVAYAPPTGGTIRGWVNSLYTAFSLGERTVSLDDLAARGLLTVLPDDTRGGFTAGAGAVRPTADPLRDQIVAEVNVNPDASLHFRRFPSAQSESLALLPAGTRLRVTGRTEAGDWLQVEYQETTGYVATAYVILTRNERAFNLADVPVVTVEMPAGMSSGAPTLSPAQQSGSGSGGPLTAPVGAPLPTGTDDPNLDPVPGQ